MFLIKEIKILGFDGYGSGFYKVIWFIICEDIIFVIFEFFKIGKIFKKINIIYIFFIFKVKFLF